MRMYEGFKVSCKLKFTIIYKKCCLSRNKDTEELVYQILEGVLLCLVTGLKIVDYHLKKTEHSDVKLFFLLSGKPNKTINTNISRNCCIVVTVSNAVNLAPRPPKYAHCCCIPFLGFWLITPAGIKTS